ncbi:MAG: hypothetical protein Q8Q86_00860 [Candidatus Daviesbacteria bacterium]|nr:hypothetical protein [Candidatus Daviesbacteria bacterium]
MDNSNPVPEAPVANTPPQPSIPTQPVVPEESNKMVLWLVIGLIVIIAVVGGIYFFFNNQQAATNTQKVTENPIVQSTPKPPDTVDALDRDLSAINVDDAEVDFVSIDSDLQQL